MGKWYPNKYGKITSKGGGFLARANDDEEAKALCDFHNAERAAYKAQIKDLQAEITDATKTLLLVLKHLHGDDYTLDGTESISTLATLAMHALAVEAEARQ